MSVSKVETNRILISLREIENAAQSIVWMLRDHEDESHDIEGAVRLARAIANECSEVRNDIL